ncbi:MAG: DNA-directed RNA polymerase subunit omega [Clostridia bacterium]|nr:DNA-directed RNA polymerase subunit omega [Clostridia bacterium]
MIYPSIQDLLKLSPDQDGNQRLNKYMLVMATAKCARVITNEYLKDRKKAEKLISEKKTEKDIAALVNKEYRDEKAVRNAVKGLDNGEFKLYFPEDEGYEDSLVDVSELKPFDDIVPDTVEENTVIDDGEDDLGEEELNEIMGADEVFDSEKGFFIEDGEEN